MATVVNNAERADSPMATGTGWIVAIIVLLAIVLLFLFGGAFLSGNRGVSDTVDDAASGIQGAVNGGASGSVGGQSGSVSGGASGEATAY